MNKKAVSLMVSYVLLIVIAIGVSVLVYNYLKLYVPGENKKCPADVFLVIDEAKCSYLQKTLNITLTNRGLFNISAVFIRVGPKDKSVKLQINAGNETLLRPLAPGRSDNYPNLKIPPNIIITQDSNNEVEIQPALIINKYLVPCENAIATQTFVCS